MSRRGLAVLAGVGLVLACSAAALAWWDTLIPIFRPVPLVKEIEAENCIGVAPDMIQTDAEANGGRGGKAVLLKPGGPGLTTELQLEPGLYAIFAIARDPAGQAGNDLCSLEVKEQRTGQTRSWTMIVVYRESYFATVQMYFPAYAGGQYALTLKLADKMNRMSLDPEAAKMLDPATLTLKKALKPLLVDRLELRDVLANCAKQAFKTKRMLTSDEELAAIRRQFRVQGAREMSFGRESFASVPAPRSAQERLARNDKIWAMVPDFNEHVSHNEQTPYGWVIGRDRRGLVADAADLYEKTGSLEFGWDGAVVLCALTEKFPTIDYFAQGIGGNLTSAQPFTFSISPGKSVYRGWAGPDMFRLAKAYDQLFDFMRGNKQLADYVGKKIPWVKTPEDVIKLVDTNLLQAGLDDCNRTYIEGDDAPKALIPLVQGVNPLSDKMLETGIFDKMCMNMTFRGGIDDQAICSYSRDGVHYIGSVGYLSQDLLDIAQLLHRYRLAGGAPRFDLMDAKLYPQMTEADSTIAQVSVAGGFPLIVGDARDLRVGRSGGYKPAPSRVLGGFGQAILESGQFQDNPLLMRAVGLHFGIGRGHAQQDTLNIEVCAQGCRVSPDLGGRHEPPHKGYPNMRWNKVHDVVEVDDRNFENPTSGSTTSATGWTTSFSPLPGSQFMEHAARATSHPQVSLYARQTALIDVGPRDSYIFDVFRVRGGKVHTYCFHGCPTEALRVNAELKPAASATATNYLADHFAGTQKEGTAPAALEADWPMDPGLQKSYQQNFYEPDKVVTTRLTLFGHAGDQVMVGNAYSKMYEYNFPFLYSRSEQPTDGKESVFPAIIEPFAGQPFITAKRELKLDPAPKGADAPVALEVKTSAGATDLLYASGRPAQITTVEGNVRASGKFAVISRDPQGVRLAHLVGGTELVAEDVAIRAERASWEGMVSSVKYDDRSFLLDQAVPPALLKGAVVLLGNDRHHEPFVLEKLAPEAKGTRIVHEKTAKYYQSTIVRVGEDAREVECEIEPPVYGSDRLYCNGTTVVGEAQDKFWKTTLHEGDGWMNLGYPGYRGSWPNTIAWEDIPDANRDGKRILELMGGKGDKDAQGNSLEGKVIMPLEVTRISPNGETFYFKRPADPAQQRRAWEVANRWLWNEGKSRKWLAMYPGWSFQWQLAAAVTKADFADADRDGRAKLSAYVFGPGDKMQVDTFVYVRRKAAGEYEIRANVPFTLGLPKANFLGAQISNDGKTYRPVATPQPGVPAGQMRLNTEDLGNGTVFLKLAA